MPGTIWYFAVITLLGFFFCLFVVKETRGLTDLQKKTLYSRKNLEMEKDIQLAVTFDSERSPDK